MSTYNAITEIIKNRDCGSIRISFTSVWDSENIGAIAERFGLNSEPGTYIKITSNDARKIVLKILERDLAHRSPMHVNAKAVDELFESLQSSTAYTNIYPDNNYEDLSVGSSNPATKSTFDAGVILLAGKIALCIWVEDED